MSRAGALAGLAALCAAAMLAACGGGTSTGSATFTTASSTAASTPGHAAASVTTAVPPPSSTTTSVSASNTSAPAQKPALAGGFTVASPAFHDQGAIPAQYTCKGADVSLPLTISGAPATAKELVVAMRDPNAPSGDFIHWALAGISPSTHTIPAGGVPGLVAPGRNSYGSLGYRGPCPPTGQVHHYVITVTALGSPSGLRAGFTLDALRTSAVGIATLTGTFQG